MLRISVLIKGEMRWRSYDDATIDEGDWCVYVIQYDRANNRKVKYVFPKSEIAELTIRRDSDETEEQNEIQS